MADTTLDTEPISELIDEFRKLTAKDSITPETLGYILQRIADLLSEAASGVTAATLQSWYESMRTAPDLISNLVQGTADRNHLYLTQTTTNPVTGETIVTPDSIKLQQATTARAGAMRAQHVDDLYQCKDDIDELQDSVADLQTQISNGISAATQEFHYQDPYGEIKGKCYALGSLCMVIGHAYCTSSGSVSTLLPYPIVGDYHPTINIYDEDSMQWVRVSLYTDNLGSHIEAAVPEDFMNQDYYSAHFSITYPIQ